MCSGRFVRELKKERKSWGAEEKAVRSEQSCGNRKTERKKSGALLSFFSFVIESGPVLIRVPSIPGATKATIYM